MDRIIRDPAICSGKPVVRGSRILVTTIQGMQAGGYTVAEILAAFPELSEEDVIEALNYSSGN